MLLDSSAGLHQELDFNQSFRCQELELPSPKDARMAVQARKDHLPLIGTFQVESSLGDQ